MFGRRSPNDGIPGLSDNDAEAGPLGIPGSLSDARSPQPAANPFDTGAAPAEQPAPTPATGAPAPAKRRRLGCLLFAIVPALFIGGGVYGTFAATRGIERALEPLQQITDGEITPTDSRSLLATNNMTRALAALREELPRGGRVESMRISAARIDATLSQPDGTMTLVSIDANLRASRLPGGARQPVGIPLSRIKPELPNLLLQRAERKLGLKPEDLDYVLLSTWRGFDGRRADRWGIYYSRPPLNNDAVAALDGTDVRLIGTPDKATRDAIRRAEQLAAQARARAEAAR